MNCVLCLLATGSMSQFSVKLLHLVTFGKDHNFLYFLSM